MSKKDISWMLWGLATCMTFGAWQQSFLAGIFMFYAIIFVLITIAEWN